MLQTKLSLINFILFIAIVLVTLLLIFQIFFCKKELNILPPKIENAKLPKNPFEQSLQSYENIGKYGLFLAAGSPRLSLPDLRNELIYPGRNQRPDLLMSKHTPFSQIELKSSGECSSVYTCVPLFLLYSSKQASNVSSRRRPPFEEEKSLSQKGYIYSPHNRPSPLWIEVTPMPENDDGEDYVKIVVHMFDENRNLITFPKEHHEFLLKAENASKSSRFKKWELGGNVVDSTLLVRQKTKWIGLDLFLRYHGGDDFASSTDKERIDFHHLDNKIYSCFVNEGDYLIWKEGKWQSPSHEDNTSLYPLLVVKKIEENMITFDLWDLEGTAKTHLTLLKIKTHEKSLNLREEFRFVGAKTWNQFILETSSVRILVQPNDWFILTEEGWLKFSTPEMIDQYVEQTLKGPLFVVEKMIRENGKQTLIGHLFNSARTEMIPIVLPMSSTSNESSYVAKDLDSKTEEPSPFPPFEIQKQKYLSSRGGNKKNEFSKAALQSY